MHWVIRALVIVAAGGAVASASTSPSPSDAASGETVFASNYAVNLQWPDVFVVRASGGHARNLTRSAEIDEQGAAWSPDGKRIAFGSQLRTKASSDIFAMNADGTDIVQLTTDREIDEAPAWSPDGRRIAFNSFRGQRHRIWVMNADGSNQHPITGIGTESAVDPTWSPDGRRLAFSGADVEIVNADGTGHRVVARGDAFAIEWSRSGRIGFIRDTVDVRAVFSIRPNGTGLRRLTGPKCDAEGLAWSPSGRAFVVACSGRLWIYRADGKQRRRLRVRQPRGAVERAVSFEDLSWSRAGIAYAASSEGNDSDIRKMGAEGTNPRTLARSPLDEVEPASSPNGRWVAYVVVLRKHGGELYLLDTRARRVRRLTRNRVPEWSPAWSWDGSTIAFERSGDLYTMRRNGTGIHRLTATRRRETDPAWARDGRLAFTADRSIFVRQPDGAIQRLTAGESPAWSPDDRLIAFTRAGGLYVMNADGSGQRQVTQVDPDNPDSSPTWSADGGTIVFARGKARIEIQDWNGREFVLEIFSVRADGSGLTRLTRNAVVEDFDPSWRNNN